ncbi:uncharacterized protein F4822DRAFT_177373 [Hypoxylon trugodes]|uniref:uncharacterized protein n=1 Tax=Hypoxylon trugodes TaxID=326681 RepID=UPI002194256E|nr:uncharacterized protein F4822DRAFT_177373 [Hypoxylon trugodes]KAI1391200.1 hypothetical protein F4822DRAFT_177373 [Hypoxylon trugodes]
MMPTLMGANMPQAFPQLFPSEPTFAELSQQLAMSDSMRRISRSSTTQRTPGSMRIMKPTSANNSPQAMMARRRTMMNDNTLARRRQQAFDQAVLQQMQEPVSYSTPEDPVKRSNRPVSWHPTSHLQQPHMHIPMPQPDFSQYVIPAPMPYNQGDIYSGYQNLPPTPAVYSGQTSPMATVSPLCLPYSTTTQHQPTPAYISQPQETWIPTQQYVPESYAVNGSPGESEPFPAFTDQTSLNWDCLAAHGFNVCTAPPTPDEFQPVQQQEPAVPPEESIPYQPLEEPEEEGEILVGMGLYDPPSKTDTDPELDNYRTTTSQFLDTTYRGRGQGWKLEEAWEPPASDDEEDGEGDDEEEEEDQTEEKAEKDKKSESTTAEENWI